MNNIAIGDDIVLAFQAPFTCIFRTILSAVVHVVSITDNLCADKSFLEIGVDHPRCLWCRGTFLYSPGPHFLGAGGEVGLQAQYFVAGANHAVQARFLHAQILQKLGLLFRVQLGDFCFQLVADCHQLGAFRFCNLFDCIEVRIIAETLFIHVGNIHNRLDGKQVQVFQVRKFFFVEVQGAHRLRSIQVRLDLF